VDVRWKRFSIVLLAAALSGGCDATPATFPTSARTQALYRPARDAVEKELLADFGTPQQLVAWLKLPLDYGGVAGKVKEAPAEGSVTGFAVELAPGARSADLRADASLVFVSGGYAGQKMAVRSFDAEQGRLDVAATLEKAPAAGDEFVVDPGRTLKDGRRLYMTHCVHCHGTGGDGNGPTAKYLNPRPRDYRQGKFKFTSTRSTEKAAVVDIRRIVKEGIPGTYMPSFYLLKDAEAEAITTYVLWLAMRGEIEHRLVAEASVDFSQEAVRQRQKSEKKEEIDQSWKDFGFPDVAASTSDAVAGVWQQAQQEGAVLLPKAARPDATAESIARGRKVFLSDKAKCAQCHGPLGKGDGFQTEAFQENSETKKKYAVPGLHDDWGNPIKPRNLTQGIYRGGRRPVDLYRRVAAGIKGTPMGSFATALTEDEIWDVVNYVLHVPFEGQSAAPTDKGAAAPAVAHGH
jgi:mono/diheme cytochrome c family protein